MLFRSPFMPPRAAVPGDASAAPPPVPPAASLTDQAEGVEKIFYEGSGSNVELALSVALGFTLIYLPLTLASIGRRLWISYRFTNKRVVVTTNSPALKREVQARLGLGEAGGERGGQVRGALLAQLAGQGRPGQGSSSADRAQLYTAHTPVLRSLSTPRWHGTR